MTKYFATNIQLVVLVTLISQCSFNSEKSHATDLSLSAATAIADQSDTSLFDEMGETKAILAFFREDSSLCAMGFNGELKCRGNSEIDACSFAQKGYLHQGRYIVTQTLKLNTLTPTCVNDAQSMSSMPFILDRGYMSYFGKPVAVFFEEPIGESLISNQFLYVWHRDTIPDSSAQLWSLYAHDLASQTSFKITESYPNIKNVIWFSKEDDICLIVDQTYGEDRIICLNDSGEVISEVDVPSLPNQFPVVDNQKMWWMDRRFVVPLSVAGENSLVFSLHTADFMGEDRSVIPLALPEFDQYPRIRELLIFSRANALHLMSLDSEPSCDHSQCGKFLRNSAIRLYSLSRELDGQVQLERQWTINADFNMINTPYVWGEPDGSFGLVFKLDYDKKIYLFRWDKEGNLL